MIVGDAANLLLCGIPGDLHDEFVMDVEPADLVQASGLLAEMSASVRTIHVKLSGSVASLEGRWHGDGAAAFDSEIWQPLSHGLGVLERECGTAGSELARLALQAEQAHLYKVEELNREIQNQLYIFAATSLIGGPELGGVISEAVGGLAARLGGELVGRIVAGIVDSMCAVLRKVLDAFYDLLRWVARPLAVSSDLGSRVDAIVARLRSAATPVDIASVAVPRQVLDVLSRVDGTGGAPLGFKGGGQFLNDGRRGAQLLARTDNAGNAITYREWDVTPYQPGVDRGAERLVTGSDGSAWYTNDHYNSFVRVR